MPSKHPNRRRSRLFSTSTPRKILSLISLVLPVASAATTAIQYPIPASIFQTYTSAGNPILHIQPSFYHSSNPSATSLLSFKSIFLANPSSDAYLDDTLLSDGFSQDVDGVQVPNFSIDGGKGVVLFSRADGNYTGTSTSKDTGEVWLMTYPTLCRDISNATVKDYTLWRSGAGREDWEEVKLEGLKRNLSIWFPTPRYLGKGFMVDDVPEEEGDVSSDVSAGERFYTFGGVCISGNHYKGSSRNDTFSADVWRVENSTAVFSSSLRSGGLADDNPTTTRTTRTTTKDDNTDALAVGISISKNPPIPEAGFSMNPLTVAKNSTAENDTTTVDGMLILGGYTSLNRFVGLGQLALYSPKTEEWKFVSASLKDEGITPRAGHSAVVDQDGKRIVIFGGWIGNVTRAAKPAMVVLKVGDLSGGWEWDGLNATEADEGASPGDLSLWGHAATLLEGNVMMLTSGFQVSDLDDQERQPVNQKTWYLNLTSNEWVKQYRFPLENLTKSAVDEITQRKSNKDIAILGAVFGGLVLLVAVLAGLFWYARRQEEYADLPNEGMSTDGRDKFYSLDLENGNGVIVTGGLPSLNVNKRGMTPMTTITEETGGLLREEMTRSPELPPRPPAPLKTHRHSNQPSHVDMYMVERMREEQEQRENMFQDAATQEKRRSVRSEMVAWVREWANADAAAQAAEVMSRTRQDSTSSGGCKVRKESTTLGSGNESKDMFLRPSRAASSTPKSTAATTGAPDDTRCITSSSMYSDGQVSTLEASESFDTPDEIPYPVPPMLLSSAQAYGQQSPRNPRVLVGPQGVIASLPKRMAEEFPAPTLIPRDSLASYGSGGYNHYFYSSTQPLLRQAQSSGIRDSEGGWRDITPSTSYHQGLASSSNSNFYNIPLTTFEEETHIHRGKPLEDSVREEMYNPGPARTDEDSSRLSSIMDYYADSKSPTPIPELSEGTDSEEDGGEEGYLVSGLHTTTYAGERAVVGEKGKTVVITQNAVEEPATVDSIRVQPRKEVSQQRESVIAPLLSETMAAQRKEEGGKAAADKPTTSRSRIPSLGSSIKRRAATVAATLNPNIPSSGRRSASQTRKNALNRRGPQTSMAGAGRKPAQSMISESTPLQPQQAEIMNINDRATDVLFARGFEDRDDRSSMNIDDKVVQLVYTAPKGKLRVVNPSPRRVSSGGTTDGNLALFQQMQAQRRVSSSGNYPAIYSGEGILRLGSAAARRLGELD